MASALGSLRLVELAPIAGCFWQGIHRAICEIFLIILAYIRDGVVGSIITADYITHLRNILRIVLGDIDGVSVFWVSVVWLIAGTVAAIS